MYTKFEIMEIFDSIKTQNELDQVLEVFCWLIQNNFQERTQFLHMASTFAFRRIQNLRDYGN